MRNAEHASGVSFILQHSSFSIPRRTASMNARSQVLLWTAQRASAAVLALCVVVHLITIIYAVRSGLSAAEILGRTRGSYGWLGFYLVFVAAVSVHAPIVPAVLERLGTDASRGLSAEEAAKRLRERGPNELQAAV